MARRKLAAPEAHLLKVCDGMARIVAAQPPFPTTPDREAAPYEALFRAIVFQQLSGKAAQTILNRVVALFPRSNFPSPRSILLAPAEKLRGAGLSRQKIAALKDLAAKRQSGLVPDKGEIEHLPDPEIIERLSAVRGVGRWTVEMYLIFTLGRPDVLPVDDLAVRKGAERLFARSFTPKELDAFGVRWTPWRSAAAWHFWRLLETKTPDA
ncbi:MAG: DNA-3-methyladenine glycosylase [Hyphomonadaceae bacterium]